MIQIDIAFITPDRVRPRTTITLSRVPCHGEYIELDGGDCYRVEQIIHITEPDKAAALLRVRLS